MDKDHNCLPNNSSYLYLQKIIYKQMSIKGAVRVIKGQEVLPVGSTLEENGITDGSTVNIVIEPDKDINLRIKLGPRKFIYKVSSSMRVRELKQQLIDGGKVDGIATDVPLVDETLPLHLCGLGDNTTLRVTGGNVTIELFLDPAYRYFYTFSKTMKVKQIKESIRAASGYFFTEPSKVIDFCLFVQQGESYTKSDNEALIGSVLFDKSVVHVVENRFFQESQMAPVYHRGELIGRIGYNPNNYYFSMVLRAQELFGFPASCIKVKGASVHVE